MQFRPVVVVEIEAVDRRARYQRGIGSGNARTSCRPKRRVGRSSLLAGKGVHDLHRFGGEPEQATADRVDQRRLQNGADILRNAGASDIGDKSGEAFGGAARLCVMCDTIEHGCLQWLRVPGPWERQGP
jgi:hypothetical protein